MENNCVIIRCFNAVDSIADEGWIALKILATINTESNIGRCHLIAACKGNIFFQFNC